MKQSIYNAPEGFFSDFETTIRQKTHAIRSRRRKMAGLAAAALASIAIVVFTPVFSTKVSEADLEDEELLSIYEYDIFLNSYQL